MDRAMASAPSSWLLRGLVENSSWMHQPGPPVPGWPIGTSLTGGNLLTGHVTRVGTAALDHEARNVAVKLETIIESHGGELAKIGHMNRGSITVELYADGTLASLDHGDLIACDLILGGTGLPMEHGCPPLSSLHTGNIIPRTAPDELGALFLYRLPGVHVFLELHDVDRLAVNFLDTAQRSQDLILVVGGTLAIG